MKRVLALVLTLASLGVTASAAESRATPAGGEVALKAAAAPAAVQWRRARWNRGRVRVTTRTRLMRVGRRVYRETYQVRRLPNGRTQTRLISRVRVR